MRPRMIRFDLDSLGTSVAPLSGINVNLKKLGGPGGRKKGGQILKVARIIGSFPVTVDVNATTATGIVRGRRFYEIVSRVQMQVAGWPVDYSHDCSAKVLRRHAIMMHGHLPNRDPLDLPDTTATDTAARLIVPIEFFRERHPRGEDFCPAAAHVAEGTLSFNIAAIGASGISGETIVSPVRWIAECFYGDAEVPVFSRLRERNLGTSAQRFNLNVSSDRLACAWLMGFDNSQAAATDNVAFSFDESRSIQFDVGDETTRQIEDLTIEELVETYNREVLTDGAVQDEQPTATVQNSAGGESSTVPEIVPLVISYNEKTTKLPRAKIDAFVESSGQLQDTATGTGRAIGLVTDEIYEPKRGSKAVDEYLKTGRADGQVTLHRVTLSKKQDVSPDKAGAMPLRIKSALRKPVG